MANACASVETDPLAATPGERPIADVAESPNAIRQASSGQPAAQGPPARTSPSTDPVAVAAPSSPRAATGLALVICASLAFSVMALCVSLLHTRVPSLEIAFTRYAVSTLASVCSVAWARRGTLSARVTWLGRPEHRRLLIMRGVWGAGGMTSYFYALSVLDLSDASALAFTQVPLTAIAARLLLGEPYTLLDAACAVLCMAGVVLVAQPAALFSGAAGGGAAVPWLAVCTSLFGAGTAALAYVTVRQMQGADPLVITLFFSAVGALITPLLMLATWRPPVLVASLTDGGLLAVVGVAGFLGQVLLNRGVQLAPAGPATVMRYADILFAMVFQATLLREPPAPLKVLGAALIMSCVAAVLVRARRGAGAAAAAASAAAAAAAVETGTAAAAGVAGEGVAAAQPPLTPVCSTGTSGDAAGGEVLVASGQAARVTTRDDDAAAAAAAIVGAGGDAEAAPLMGATGAKR